ncbi:hypothetical protein [Cerasicoccus frondis]|uniref:hypothetical protein n=1 Tax=Cerasicoccus frondis TaxID=490090 RepID=UPI0028524BC4|nr:hypothetical protein [Cerasicoccus frondis]
MKSQRWALIVGLSLTAFYLVLVYRFGFVGWIAWDEGALGQMAERIHFGEFPHTHYDCMYTGFLSMLHAGWYWLFGIDLSTLRGFLFFTNYVFLAAFYCLALRLTQRVSAAGMVTLTAMLWGCIQYPTSMPSYQVTFLTLGVVMTLMLHHRTGLVRWALLAGFLCALTILIKITGLYLVMALGYYWIYDNQNRAARQVGWGKWQWSTLTLGISACLLLPPLMIGKLVAHLWQSGGLAYFILPFIGLAAVIIERECRLGRTTLRTRAMDLFRVLWPYAAGLLIGLAPFILFYASIGGLGALLHGTLIAPFARVASQTTSSSYGLTAWTLTAVAVCGALLFPRRLAAGIVLLCVALGGAYVMFFESSRTMFFALWTSAPWMAPLAGLLPLVSRWTIPAAMRSEKAGAPYGDFILLVAGLANVSLLQFPYAVPIYYLYVIPLVMLVWLAYLRMLPEPTKAVYLLQLGLPVFFIAYALIHLEKGPRASMWIKDIPLHHAIETPRSGIDVSAAEFVIYLEASQLIEKLAPDDEYIYAFPDSPHIYFLNGKRNPTRALFDLLGRGEEDYASDETLALLEEKKVNLVIINIGDTFSPRPSRETIDKLQERYPNATLSLDKRLLYLWRDSPTSEATP